MKVLEKNQFSRSYREHLRRPAKFSGTKTRTKSAQFLQFSQPLVRRACLWWRSEWYSNRWYGRAAVVIEPVSVNSLRRTGVLQECAGDFRQIHREDLESRSLETKSNVRKAWISRPSRRRS